jgi:hypothetical protein
MYGKCCECAASETFTDPNNLRGTKLKCRRHAPIGQSLLVPQGNGQASVMTITTWPLVQDADGCFEFISKTKKR